MLTDDELAAVERAASSLESLGRHAVEAEAAATLRNLAERARNGGWLPIESAPKDGTVIDLWMNDDSGAQWREANAYWVTNRHDEQMKHSEDGSWAWVAVVREGWFAPNHDYDGQDGWADTPRYYNAHPMQKRWIWREATHWQPLPAPPKD